MASANQFEKRKGLSPVGVSIAARYICAINICCIGRGLSCLWTETYISISCTVPSLVYAPKVGLLPAAGAAIAGITV